VPERFDAGGAIDGGFHVIREGTVEVSANGGPPEELGAGESFGMDALLRDAPSAARALTPVAALTLARSDFVSRVTPPARAAIRAARAGAPARARPRRSG
jgi:CRP-like cAMP-binding protein